MSRDECIYLRNNCHPTIKIWNIYNILEISLLPHPSQSIPSLASDNYCPRILRERIHTVPRTFCKAHTSDSDGKSMLSTTDIEASIKDKVKDDQHELGLDSRSICLLQL